MADDSTTSEKSKKRKLKGMKAKLVLLVVILLAAAAVGGGVLWTRYENLKKENARLSNPQEAAQAEADRTKSEVAALIELPGETPTIATVVDVDKLKEQQFFANAENGDKVLIFPEAKKAILYRPSTKKIVEVAPLNIGEGTTTPANSNQE